VTFKGLTGHALDNVASQSSAVVGVGGNFSRGKQRRALVMLEIVFGGDELLGVVRQDRLKALLETGAVRHQIAHGDRLRRTAVYLEVQVVIDVAIEIEFALFDQLHDRGPGEKL